MKGRKEMLNRIILIGRLTRDPEMRYTPSGITVTRFTLAVDRNYKSAQGEKMTDFITVVAWRQLAELCAEYLAKGKLAAVDGRLQVRSYDAQDGTRKTVAEVVAENVRFLSPKQTNTQENNNDFIAGEAEIYDDDLPF
jgi:single-strand DNA-binding protein